MDLEQAGEREPERERPAEAAGGPATGIVATRLARAGVVLAALAIGGCVWFLAPASSALNKSLGGGRLVTPMLLAGAVVAAAVYWAANRFLKPRLAWTKPGQGVWVRGAAYGGMAALALFGGYAVHDLPALTSAWAEDLVKQVVFGKTFALKPIFFPAAAFSLVWMLAFHLVANAPRSADFLIETQSEMRKVSWPARKEWVGSTVVVLVVMSALALFLSAADWGLSHALKWLGIGI